MHVSFCMTHGQVWLLVIVCVTELCPHLCRCEPAGGLCVCVCLTRCVYVGVCLWTVSMRVHVCDGTAV